MALITREEVLKIAHMSRITIHEDEIEPLIKRLNGACLCSTGKPSGSRPAGPTAQNVNVFREDVAIPCNAARIKQEAPEIEEDYFVVPAIFVNEE